MPSSSIEALLPKRKKKRDGKKGRKYGRKHRNGKPHGMNGGCGCEFCRRLWRSGCN